MKKPVAIILTENGKIKPTQELLDEITQAGKDILRSAEQINKDILAKNPQAFDNLTRFWDVSHMNFGKNKII